MSIELSAESPHEAVRRHGERRLLHNRLPVALIATALSALAFASYGVSGTGVIAAVIALVLVIVSATDLERRVIPNRVVLPAAAIVLVAHGLVEPVHAAKYLLAAVAAGLAFLIPNLVSRSSIGMGDVKLATFLGAGLGWSVVGALIVAFLSVFPFAFGVLLRRGLSARKATLPFGPFLAFGGLVILIVPRLVGLGGS